MYWFLVREGKGDGERERDRERKIDLLVHLCMHSLVDMCPDWIANLQSWCLEMML